VNDYDYAFRLFDEINTAGDFSLLREKEVFEIEEAF
jgi:hypothetical protein